jgi:hypothetical protein
MSGNSRDWFKFRKKLPTDPRVLRIASRLRDAAVTQDALYELAALGALAKFWGFADTHVSDDDRLNLGADEVNKIVGVANFCDLLPADWFKILDAECVQLPDFLKHNGTSAKTRALGQVRTQRWRNGRDDTVTPPSRKSDASVTRKPSLEEKRIDIKNPPNPPGGLDLLAWARWVDYRKAVGKQIKPPSADAAMRKLAGYGPAQAATVEHNIANGNQGLYAIPQPARSNGYASPSNGVSAAPPLSAEWSELLSAGRAEGLGEPYKLETPQAYAERLRGFRAKRGPRIDTSGLTAKLRGLA